VVRCWHFDGADGSDAYFESFVSGNSGIRFERIVYTITAG
jgi:hypothetical protein